ncbi:MFS transporter [Streptomyces sp. I05A-00742]|uniref:MFS transporter n=1 Tax=Streptomyces sp. I05A-00742 TaxID=2732853 RepID=UPI0014884141|nr:MFS transporter [Streptomyces sp. I05A-00742]
MFRQAADRVLGAGIYLPMAATTAAALVAPEQRGGALGLVLGGLSIGTVLGMPAGLALAHLFGWRLTLWAVTGLGLLALIGISILLPGLPGSPPVRLRRRMAVLGDPKVASIVVVSFVANVASLGLHTYLAPVLKSVGHIGNPIPYLATWGIGGILGSLLIGVVIDRTRRSFSLFTVVMLVFTAAMVVVPLAGGVRAILVLPLLVRGAAGFASPAPQQEQLLAARPDNSNVVVALNDSAIYLGSAVGSALFGAVLAAGLPMSALPYVAAGFRRPRAARAPARRAERVRPYGRSLRHRLAGPRRGGSRRRMTTVRPGTMPSMKRSFPPEPQATATATARTKRKRLVQGRQGRQSFGHEA